MLPPNYFCQFEFNLNPRISYDIAIKKFFFSWEYQNEIIDLEVISAMEGSNSYLQDSYLWVTNSKDLFQLNDMVTLGQHPGYLAGDVDDSKVIGTIRNSMKVNFFARNLAENDKGTFSISVRRTPPMNQSTVQIIYTVMLVFAIGIVLFGCWYLGRTLILKSRESRERQGEDQEENRRQVRRA